MQSITKKSQAYERHLKAERACIEFEMNDLKTIALELAKDFVAAIAVTVFVIGLGIIAGALS